VRQLHLAIKDGLLSRLDEITPVDDINGELTSLVALATTQAKIRTEARLQTEYTVTFLPGPFGISIVRGDDGRVRINAVHDGTQAQALGVRPNSVVLQVAGEAVHGLGYDAVRSMIMQSERPLTLVLGHEAPPSAMRFYTTSMSDLESRGSSSTKKAVGKRSPIGFRFGGSKKNDMYPAAEVPNDSSELTSSLSATRDHRASMDQDELALSGAVQVDLRQTAGIFVDAGGASAAHASSEAGAYHGHELQSLRETFDNEENEATKCVTPRLSRTSSADL